MAPRITLSGTLLVLCTVVCCIDACEPYGTTIVPVYPSQVEVLPTQIIDPNHVVPALPQYVLQHCRLIFGHAVNCPCPLCARFRQETQHRLRGAHGVSVAYHCPIRGPAATGAALWTFWHVLHGHTIWDTHDGYLLHNRWALLLHWKLYNAWNRRHPYFYRVAPCQGPVYYCWK